jgi:hypothetical protein
MAVLAISSNLDCGYRISYRARNVRIPFSAYLLITGINGTGHPFDAHRKECLQFPAGFSILLGAFVIAMRHLDLIKGSTV